jgi:hypothetical protein
VWDIAKTTGDGGIRLITYKDKAFCTQQDCAKFNQCPAAATDKVRTEAATAGLPISLIAFVGCFEPKQEEAEDV